MKYHELNWISETAQDKIKKNPRYAGFWSRVFAFTIDIIILYLLNFLIQNFLLSSFVIKTVVESIIEFAKQTPINFSKGIPPEFVSGIPPDAGILFAVLGGVMTHIVISVVVMAAAGVLYFVILPATNIQGTLGQWFMGIHMITKYGNKLNVFHTFMRYICMVVFSFLIPFSLAFALTPFLFPFFGPFYILLAYAISLSGVWLMLFTKKKTMLHDMMCMTRVMRGKAGLYYSGYYNKNEGLD